MKQYNMKTLKYFFAFIFLCAFAISGQIKKFEIPSAVVSITRPAQANQYMDKIGRKAALMGFENGSFELWIWPWKVMRNFDLQFFVGTTTQPVLSKDILRDITVTPYATIITFVYESFTVKEIIFVPHDKPAAVILLDVYTTTPLTIVPGFMPVMQPQWPAGIGGQYSYWDDNIKGYIISESQRRGIFLCGSPMAEQMAAPPAHMFADNPIQFKFTIEPDKADENFIPIVISGMSDSPRDSVFALYKDLTANAKKYFYETADFYKRLSETTIRITTPDEKLNTAFEFGKAALNNLLVDNPKLGRGLVAGYGLSGGGGRPGFSWFFGGDAFVNSLAMNSYGDYSIVKDALKFTQKWQRQENFPIRKKSKDEINYDIGKMAHELSQSDGLVDWWNDYHYGYNHADTTPWYLVAMGDYFVRTGDLDFIKRSWKSILQAYEWCKGKDSNGDGLMDLKGAGLGVLEFGALVKINNDMYTQGLWTQGIKAVNLMAKYTGDKKTEAETNQLLPRAVTALEKIFWMQDKGYYSFGASDDGNQVKDKNIFPTSIMLFDILDKARCESSVMNYNESDMITDWGVRNLSNKSSLYEPTNYNYGTVWGFNSIFANSAQFKYHFNISGFSVLKNTLQHIYDYGLGVFPEVFSGSINTKLGEAYHNQGFCTSGYMLPLMNGLTGLDVNALENKITFAPKIPADWKFLNVENVKSGNTVVNFKLTKHNNFVELKTEKSGTEKIDIYFRPDFAPGTKIKSVVLNGKALDFKTEDHAQAVQLLTDFPAGEVNNLTVEYEPTVEIFLLPSVTPVGAVNTGLKIISQKFENRKLSIITEGLPGNIYELGIQHDILIQSVAGAQIKDGKLEIKIPGEGNDFVKHLVEISVR